MNKRVIEIVQDWFSFISASEQINEIANAGAGKDPREAGRSTRRPDPTGNKADRLGRVEITKAQRVSFLIMMELPSEARALLSSFVINNADKSRKTLRELSLEAGFVNVEDYKIARGRAVEAVIEKDKYWRPELYFKVKIRDSREPLSEN